MREVAQLAVDASGDSSICQSLAGGRAVFHHMLASGECDVKLLGGHGWLLCMGWLGRRFSGASTGSIVRALMLSAQCSGRGLRSYGPRFHGPRSRAEIGSG